MAAVGYAVIVVSVSSIIGSPTCLLTCETASSTAIVTAAATTNSKIKMVSIPVRYLCPSFLVAGVNPLVLNCSFD